MIGIIDYGVGNLGSLERAFEEIGGRARLVHRPDDLSSCASIVLPGVGAFTDCMAILEREGWAEAVTTAAAGGQPLLGVCVGMQLLAETGDEGADGDPTPGLGLVAGSVVHLRDRGCAERVPHVGWNAIWATEAGADLFSGIPGATDVYFVHSYTFVPERPETVLARAEYGVPIVAAIGQGTVWGTQFHPEKSGKAGFRILQNFRRLSGC